MEEEGLDELAAGEEGRGREILLVMD